MKVIAFNGSPRKDGNTNFLLEKALVPIQEAGIETELIQLSQNPVRGCIGCFKCMETKNSQCIIKTDPMNKYIKKIIEANGIILGSPSYFSGMTPELKALIDRAGLVAYANDGLFARKIGAGVSVHRRGGGTNVTDSINHMFLMSKMIIPGSTYWNFGVGMNKGDVKQDQEALMNMQDLGETIAWLIKNLPRKKIIS
jgi:multimeric flavodoxin WrbA